MKIRVREGGIRLREVKTYYLDQMDQLSSSELGEYIRLRRRFLWEMHHKSTVLKILTELSEVRSDLNESDSGKVDIQGLIFHKVSLTYSYTTQ